MAMIDALEQAILIEVNAHRESLKLPALELVDMMSEEARTHSENMASEAIPFSHQGFGERASRILDAFGGNSAAENVALGPNTAKTAVKAWLESEGHRRNIEGEYTHTGIGSAQAEDSTLYHTQLFINKPTPQTAPFELPDLQTEDIEQEICELINEHRRAIGLNALEMHPSIQNEAHKHNERMAKGEISLSHEGFGERAKTLLSELHGNSAAENVAYGQSTARQAVQSWLNSTGHRKNIEDPYTHTGIAATKDAEGRYYFTQVFINVKKA